MYFSDYEFCGLWDDFFERIFKCGKTYYGVQYDWLADMDKNKIKGDILFLRYEDLKQDVISGIKKIAAFLEIKLSNALLQKILHDTNIKQMKTDEAVMGEPNVQSGSFVRSGQCGEWKKHFTVEQNEWFDDKYKKLYQELDIDIDYN